MAGKKKQHYVPQLYLSNFTTDGERLFVYDKFTRKSRPSNIRDIAHENYFYEIPSHTINAEHRAEGINEKLIEDGFADIEAKLGSAIEQIIKLRNGTPLSNMQMAKMAYYITYQILRTKEMRDRIIEGEIGMRQSLADTIVKLNFPELPLDAVKIEFDKEFAPLLQAQYIMNPKFIDEWAMSFYEMIWMLGVNETKRPLYTSDNPVVKCNHIKEVGKRGWMSPGVEINFPLSPNHILLIFERTYFKEYEQYLGYPAPITLEELIEEYNRSQVIKSYRQIYSVNDDFSFADKICGEMPEICKPRKKVQVNTSGFLKTNDPNTRKEIIHFHHVDDD